MFALKRCKTSRNRGIAVALLGASFAIQMTPPILHGWAKVGGVDDAVAMAVIIVIYLLLGAYVLNYRRSDKAGD